MATRTVAFFRGAKNTMKEKSIISLLIILFLFSNVHKAQSFVEQEYKLNEVLAESTNVVFGKLTSVDTTRKRAIVNVEENLKGTSNFKKIKMNIAVGQQRPGTSPKKFMRQLKVGLPVIIFYRQTGASAEALVHVNSTWFQLRADSASRPNSWWEFTHIEIYMHRTYKGTTEDFQKLLCLTLKPFEYAKPNSIKVLALSGNRSAAEFSKLWELDTIAKRQVVYKATQDKNLPDLEKVHILWLGYKEISRKQYFTDQSVENRIKDFVRNGGIVIVSGQDSDPKFPCVTSFLPEPLKGAEREISNGIQPTKQAGNLFKTPNNVNPEQIHINDTWIEPSSKYVVLATASNGQDVVIAKLKYGKGMYFVTALMNGKETHLKVNLPIMQNLLHFAIREIP